MTENNRNRHICTGLMAHVDSGKTTLSEALLYASGTIRKLGKVDTKDAFLDTDARERDRGITIFSKQAELTWQGMELTLLDTPGHVDFSAEMERVLQVLDYAVLLISGADGVPRDIHRHCGVCCNSMRFRRSFLSIKWISPVPTRKC